MIRKIVCATLIVISLPVIASAQLKPAQRWIGSWSASQQIPEPANALPDDDLHDATLRQIIHLSAGGSGLRVHISNAFGATALHIIAAHIAKPVTLAGSKIDPASDKELRFSGATDVIITPGGEYLSDPLDYPVKALASLAVTLHIDSSPARQTGHPGSRATSYFTHGYSVSAPDLPDAKKVDHWYFVSAIDVPAPDSGVSIVALGDSITDGHGATMNANERWTDVLAERLQTSASGANIGVLNQGIGGNHLLTDGLGPNVLARFDRDVLAQTGIRYLIVLEGINDLGALARMDHSTNADHDLLVKRMIGAYEQIIARSHAHGIKVIGATILPDVGSDYYHPAVENESDRRQVNQWIMATGHFDAVVDLDKLMSDPDNPTRLLPAYDSGDHLHPSPAGYRVMGNAFPLAVFFR